MVGFTAPPRLPIAATAAAGAAPKDSYEARKAAAKARVEFAEATEAKSDIWTPPSSSDSASNPAAAAAAWDPAPSGLGLPRGAPLRLLTGLLRAQMLVYRDGPPPRPLRLARARRPARPRPPRQPQPAMGPGRALSQKTDWPRPIN